MHCAVRCILILLTISALHSFPSEAAADSPAWRTDAQKQAGHDGYALISIEELTELHASSADFTLLDVRPDYEYEEGHIPGAINLEFHLGDSHAPSPEKLKRLQEIIGPDKNRLVVIYCRSFR